MNLAQKIVGTVIGLLLVVGAANYVVQYRLVLAGFERIERSAAETDMRRVSMTLEREMEQFQSFAADWGNWTDTYAYVIDRQGTFIEDNMNQATFDANHLDIVAYLDPASNFVWRTGIDPATRLERRYALITGAHLDPGSPFRAAVANGTPMKGIVWTEAGPAIIVVAPILDGAGGGPHRGAVLLGRVITGNVVSAIGLQAQVPLRMETLSRNLPAADTAHPTGTRLATTADNVFASRVVDDVFGRPTLKLSFEQPRVIVQSGRDTIWLSMASLTCVGLLVVLVLLLTLRRLILEPVRQIREFVRSVTTSDDLSVRLALNRADELGDTGRDLNVMVERLAAARREVIDKSFEAGLSEMARGVLHNLGNALTPVVVNAGRVRAELAALPTADIAAATDELGRADSQPDRRAGVLEYLQLANDDLQLRAAEAAKHVVTVTRGLDTIQTILQQQSRFSHAAHHVEKVALSEIVDQARSMVAPAKLAQLEVCLDRSIVGIEPLRLPRIVLDQVAQNLIVNASEAAIPGRRGRLTIAAGVEGTPGHEQLHLIFSDEGRGIAPESIAQIFRKGFSTKAASTNSGLGLHWCANVIHGLGGSLRAESPGPDRGATFHVLLPLAGHAKDDDQGSMAA